MKPYEVEIVSRMTYENHQEIEYPVDDKYQSLPKLWLQNKPHREEPIDQSITASWGNSAKIPTLDVTTWIIYACNIDAVKMRRTD